tara:strand:+ start:890 stop:1618 length:729 start_codon:yes stop_codon:yes gene_type:complete
MAEFYLTDNIRVVNDKMEYRVRDRFESLKNHNWHHILSEYGWSKIHKRWITKLNKFSKVRVKNSLYGVLDCQSDGDCFFHCIANALNERDRYEGNYYNSMDIRKMVSDSITEEQYDTIISYYRIMADASDFSEGWDPYSITSIDEFKEKITTSGHEYWGDHILLQTLITNLNINIFIMNCNTIDNDYTIYNTFSEYNSSSDSIFLIYEDMCHFKLLGNFTGMIRSYFTDSTLPYELRILYEL